MEYGKPFIKARLGVGSLQRNRPVTRPGRPTRSPGCYRSPAGKECSRACHPQGGAALRNHTPGPTSLMLSYWRPQSAALEGRCSQCKSLTLLGFLSHIDSNFRP